MLRHFPLFVSFMVIFANGISDSIKAQTITNSLVYYMADEGIQVTAADRHAGGGYLLSGENYMNGFIAINDVNGIPELIKGIAGQPVYDVIHEADSGFTTLGSRTDGSREIMYLMRWNAQGDTLWSLIAEFHSVQNLRLKRLSNQDYLISGTYFTEAWKELPLLLRVSPQGTLIWSRIYQSAVNQAAIGYSAAELPDGKLLIAGTTVSIGDHRILLIQTDAQGNPQLSRTFAFQDVNFHNCFDFAIGEEGITLFCSAGDDNALIRTGFDLNPSWGKLLQSYYAPVRYAQGNLIRNSDGSFMLAASGDWGNFLKTDNQGIPEYLLDAYVFLVDAVPADDGGIMLFGNGPLYGVKTSPGYKPQIGVYHCDSLGEGSSCVGRSDIFYEEREIISADVQYSATPAGILQSDPVTYYNLEFLTEAACVAVIGNAQNNATESGQIQAYPNPAGTWFSLDLPLEVREKFSRLDIFSSGGQIVYKTTEPSIAAGAIPCSHLPAGIYMIRVTAGNKNYTGKISIQH